VAVELAQTFVLIDKQIFLLRSPEALGAIINAVQVIHNHHQPLLSLGLKLGDRGL
jgi:hypothetical protein